MNKFYTAYDSCEVKKFVILFRIQSSDMLHYLKGFDTNTGEAILTKYLSLARFYTEEVVSVIIDRKIPDVVGYISLQG